MKMNSRPLAAMLCFLGCGAAATLAQPGTRVPVTVEQYEAAQGPDTRTVAPEVVRLHNLQRVLNGDLPVAERVASLRLVERLGGDEKSLLEALSTLAGDPKTPAELQQAAVEHMRRKGQPGASARGIQMLPTAPLGSPLRRAILEDLAAHADASMLADVVKAWAQEPPAGADEGQYRRIVEKLAGQPWDQALLAAVNAESFFARGSAMGVLAGRMTAGGLAGKLASVTPRTEAMAALKASVTQLNYLPEGGPALLALVAAWRVQPNSFLDVARLARQWKADAAYEFHIRDFHLLSRMTADPLRKMLKRDELVAAISADLAARQHVPRAGAPEGGDSFAKQAASLSLPDLWNLHLLNQMLARPRVLLALRVMAERDRADTRSAWGGLIVYEGGGAEARLYPPEKDAPADDLRYVPSRQMVSEGRDSLCRFLAHFEKANSAARAGPTADELREARAGNYYGLVVTTVSEGEFCAHYFNPQGAVVSLGRIAFKF
jgi:hypothetical protein